MIGGPHPPCLCLGRLQRPAVNAETTKAHGWKNHGILVVAENDSCLSWPEREFIRQLGRKLYWLGRKEVCYG